MLAAGGYVWTTVPVEQRNESLAARAQASSDRNIGPFAQMLAQLAAKQKGAPRGHGESWLP